ncbi:hypothetical protein LV85_04115 [Algoriphagus chordae]|uniref:Uncharacterized protein n=1 Tax=Algoriphagus chordae TaxID=237019 RepID=A0A2W7QEQ5_9BACT|nr:hypothetical protein LV85_04115 [Algoriphagus chordae]
MTRTSAGWFRLLFVGHELRRRVETQLPLIIQIAIIAVREDTNRGGKQRNTNRGGKQRNTNIGEVVLFIVKIWFQADKSQLIFFL